MRAAKQMVRDSVVSENLSEIPLEERKRIGTLILEEAFKQLTALGLTANYSGSGEIEESTVDPPSLTDFVDGCCDQIVVTLGGLSACGVPDQPCMKEVLRSNLTKIPGMVIREDGKYLKGPNYVAPRLAELLSNLRRTDFIVGDRVRTAAVPQAIGAGFPDASAIVEQIVSPQPSILKLKFADRTYLVHSSACRFEKRRLFYAETLQ